MALTLERPAADDLAGVLADFRRWPVDDDPVPLHPGDLGWFWRFGAEATAAVVRTWRRDGRLVAVGLLDGPELLRLAVAPEAKDDVELVDRLVADLGPDGPVLGAGPGFVEARGLTLLDAALATAGWEPDEPWTPLRHDLAGPLPEPGVRIELVDPTAADAAERIAQRVAVQRAAFESSTFTEERWHAMAAAPAYSEARCLVAYDDRDAAVAAVTVWSAGAGRPGLLEPMGVHRDHRGHGYGTAVTRAAAIALRDLGASSALVATRSANHAGVATYRAAGFTELSQVRDRRRPG